MHDTKPGRVLFTATCEVKDYAIKNNMTSHMWRATSSPGRLEYSAAAECLRCGTTVSISGTSNTVVLCNGKRVMPHVTHSISIEAVLDNLENKDVPECSLHVVSEVHEP